MGDFIYDLPLTDWALNFAWDNDLENELDHQHITLSSTRKRVVLDGTIVGYRITTSHLKRRTLTLFVKYRFNNQSYFQEVRMYSVFTPRRLKRLKELIGSRLESFIMLCTVRHRRTDRAVFIASEARVVTKTDVLVVKTTTDQAESRLLYEDTQQDGMSSKDFEKVLSLNELEIAYEIFGDAKLTQSIIDPSILKKLNK